MIRPPPSVPDAELLARFARHRDEAAFELLVWRYARLVGGVCRRTAGDHHAAEDAAQAAFLVLARRADRLHAPAALPGWLARVAYRCAAKARASWERERPVEGLSPVAHAPGSPDDLERVAALDAELDRLPERLRLPVVLVHLDGRTYADAAQSLGIPVGTLSGRLRRARELLRARLTRRGLAPLVGAAVLADPARVAAVSRAAVAFAAGLPSADPSAAVALGVLRAMTLPKLFAGTAAGLLAAVAAVGLAASQTPPTAPAAARQISDLDRLQGEWLFDAATDENGGNALQAYWNARLTFRKNTVAISGGPYSEAAIESTFSIDPTTSPKRMDWAVPPFYQTLLKLPAGTAEGIYRFDGDALEVCMANRPGGGPRTGPPAAGDKPAAEVKPFGPRPTEFRADAAQGHFLLRVERWQGKPGEPLKGKVTVLDPAGKPVEGAEVFSHRYRMPHEDAWRQSDTATTAADGTATLPPGQWTTVSARHPGRRLVGFTPATPAALQRGVTVRLAPEARVTGKLVCPELPALGWTNVYFQPKGGGPSWEADAAVDTGRFEFVAPPGEYQLHGYGERVGSKTVAVTVRADTPAVDLGAVELPASRWGRLIGKPAPELADVTAWVGEPTTLAKLKGNVVLLHPFNLGPPNVVQPPPTEALPALAKLAAERRAAGLRVVGVHIDRGGGVVTAGAFADATAMLRANEWGGQPLPFPVALTVADKRFDDPAGVFVSGFLSRAAHDYAVSPMTYGASVLIDRRGVVRGLFRADGTPAAERELLAKLLAE